VFNVTDSPTSEIPDKESLANLAARIDAHVGHQIRKHRQNRGITQQELARALGISYQQIQKYENGTNRISAGRLYIIAKALGTQASDFFEEFALSLRSDQLAITSEDVIQAAKELSAVPDPRVRNSIRALVRLLSESARIRR